MAFVNEYVPDEDIKPYGLDDYWHSLVRRGRPENYKLEWTIDRERDVYLMRTHIANQAFEEGDWIEFSLYVTGEVFKFRLKHGVDSSKSYKEEPYITVWDLVGFSPQSFESVSQEHVFDLLKEALTAYLEHGVSSYVKHVVVKFNF